MGHITLEEHFNNRISKHIKALKNLLPAPWSFSGTFQMRPLNMFLSHISCKPLALAWRKLVKADRTMGKADRLKNGERLIGGKAEAG